MEVKSMIIETERLILREMNQDDLPDLKEILQDAEVMYAYEGPFSDEEVQKWLNNQLRRYIEEKVGLYAMIIKATNEMIGQCGLTYQDTPKGKVLEVGYLLKKAFWHHGYATEAAKACMNYAFNIMNADEVYSIIRDTNIPSQKVAIRNGMVKTETIIKHYRGINMPHYIFVARIKQ